MTTNTGLMLKNAVISWTDHLQPIQKTDYSKPISDQHKRIDTAKFLKDMTGVAGAGLVIGACVKAIGVNAIAGAALPLIFINRMFDYILNSSKILQLAREIEISFNEVGVKKDLKSIKNCFIEFAKIGYPEWKGMSDEAIFRRLLASNTDCIIIFASIIKPAYTFRTTSKDFQEKMNGLAKLILQDLSIIQNKLSALDEEIKGGLAKKCNYNLIQAYNLKKNIDSQKQECLRELENKKIEIDREMRFLFPKACQGDLFDLLES